MARNRSVSMLSRLAPAIAGLVMAVSFPTTYACTEAQARSVDGCTPAARIRSTLQSRDLAARIDAWGRSVPEVWYDLSRLERDDQHRLVRILEDRRGRGLQAWTQDQRAMYLVLVSLMRESRLFAGIVRISGSR